MDAKRAFDIAASATGLAVLSPLFAVLAVATAARFPGKNPFYPVERLGKDGKPFSMLKFKSMTDETGPDGKPLPDDQRRTGYGKFLRVTSFDELPQLVNILKGEMSFVGPRPHLTKPDETDPGIPDSHREILNVRPGLTGPWQVEVIGTKEKCPHEKRLQLEAEYARQEPSLRRDLGMLVKTVPTVVKGHDGTYFGSPGV